MDFTETGMARFTESPGTSCIKLSGGRKCYLSNVKILNVTGIRVWRWQLRPTLNFMQLTPGLKMTLNLRSQVSIRLLENYIFWSEIGSEFGELTCTIPTKIPLGSRWT